ncbi:MAG: hypothetical protein ACRDRN_05430 [Sciscionella sp.]
MTIHRPVPRAQWLLWRSVAALGAGADPIAPRRSDPAATAGPERRDPELAALAARYGTTPATALSASPGYELVPLLDARAVGGYLHRGRWALTPGDVAAEPRDSERALSTYLDVLRERRLRPVFAAICDPRPYGRRGFFTAPSVDEAVIDLRAEPSAGLSAALRRSVNAAARAGLLVLRCRAHHSTQVATLAAGAGSSRVGYGVAGRDSPIGGSVFDEDTALAECRVVVDSEGRVRAFAIWRSYAAGTCRLLDGIVSAASAPGYAVDLLIAAGIAEFHGRELSKLSLGDLPVTSAAGKRARSWRSYLERFRPAWQPRWVALLSGRQFPAAALALAAGGLVVPSARVALGKTLRGAWADREIPARASR